MHIPHNKGLLHSLLPAILLLLLSTLGGGGPLIAGTLPRKMMFRTLTTEDGLSSNLVTSILRDTHGYLWVGTFSGLNRYDSYSVEQFFPEQYGLPQGEISYIVEDPEGNIWIKTFSGYSVFSYDRGTFSTHGVENILGMGITPLTRRVGSDKGRRYFYALEDWGLRIYDSKGGTLKDFKLEKTGLSELYLDEAGSYLMFNDGSLFVMDMESGALQTVPLPKEIEGSLAGNSPSVFLDRNGSIWVYSQLSPRMFRQPSSRGGWGEIPLQEATGKFNRISAVKEAPDGNIWISTTHTALFVYSPMDRELRNFRHDPDFASSVSSDNLITVFIDSDGTVWIGNYKDGISYWSASAQAFINHNLGGRYDVQSLCEAPDCYYLGTDGSGLLKMDKENYSIQSVDPRANVIRTVHLDSQGRVWAGTYHNGLICYDHGRVTRYDTSTSSTIASDDIYGIEHDSDGNIFIGTLNGHIQKLITSTGTFYTLYRAEQNNIRDIHLSPHGAYLYAASSGGVVKVDMKTGQSKVLSEVEGDDHPAHLYTVITDRDGRIWAGGTRGLYVMEKKEGGWKSTQVKDLGSNMVNSLCEDRFGHIWVGTGVGVSQIFPGTSPLRIRNYTQREGLGLGSINDCALFPVSSGDILLGTSRGITEIIPTEDSETKYAPTLHLSSVDPVYGSLSDMLGGKSLENAEEIVLKEGFPFLMLGFSDLVFNQGRPTYFYRLRDEDDWSEAVGNRIQLGHLPAGKYTLQVRSRNSDYVYSQDVKVLSIRVQPPWYRTPLSLCLWGVLLLTGAGAVAYAVARKRRRDAQALKEKEEILRQREMADMKVQFFANVSHDLRTPLTLIINPLDEYMERNPSSRNSLLSTARNNAGYLLELINQLLDYRKLDAGAETMNYVHGNILSLIQDQMASFSTLAQKRGIDFKLTSEETELMADFDYNKMRKVVMNILSNAFKYTEDGGKIEVRASRQDGNISLQFLDTGCGIKEGDREKVFRIFFQSEVPSVPGQGAGESGEGPSVGGAGGGSGLGLYIVARYVKMHEGVVGASPNIPKGTIISILIPIKAAGTVAPGEVIPSDSPQGEALPAKAEGSTHNGYTILVVDDNSDFLNFMAYSLSSNYNILKASNGKEALDLVREEDPDLVISDVMMPVMDGLELCSQIKTDIRTSHIPVILLTARVGEQYQREGLENGADDYIAKPFSMDILRLRIEKMISDAVARRGAFRDEIKIEPSKITITPLDRQFVQKAIQIIEDHIDDPNFSVELLADGLNISRSYLYKKLVMISGKVPIAFIREIRMKRAAQWLLESQLQVSEIAYKMGYNSPKVFTRNFKEVFGMTPTEYQKKNAEKTAP